MVARILIINPISNCCMIIWVRLRELSFTILKLIAKPASKWQKVGAILNG